MKIREPKKDELKKQYHQQAFSLLKTLFSHVDDEFINNFLSNQVNQYFQDYPIVLDKGDDHEEPSTISEFVDLALNNKLSGYGAVYDNNKETSIVGNFLLEQVEDRSKVKEDMFEYVNDKEGFMYNYLKMAQERMKVFSNSAFGCFLEASFVLFNHITGSAITYSGHMASTSVIMALESLTDNLFFYNQEEVYKYFTEISETIDAKETLYKFSNNSDNKTIDQVLARYYSKIYKNHKNKNFMKQIMDIAMKSVISKYTGRHAEQDILNFMYYTNNMYELLNTISLEEDLYPCYDFEYVDCNKPHDSVKVHLKKVSDVVKEFDMFVFKYNKTDLINIQRRTSIMLTDTDSVFFNLDRFYLNFDAKTGFEKELLACEEELVIKQGKIALLNIPIYMISRFLERFLWELADRFGIEEEDRKWLMMKSELLYDTLLLTYNKKWYAGSIIANEGKMLTTTDYDIKGIQIKKVFMSNESRKRLKEILEDVLNYTDQKSISNVIQKLNKFETEIVNSMKNKEITFVFNKPYKPDYKDPVTQEVFRGCTLWNNLFKDNPIQYFDNTYMIKLTDKFEEDFSNSEEPDAVTAYNAILAFEPRMQGNMNIFCMPTDIEEIPEFLIDYIDYDAMVQNNVNSFSSILEALGMVVVVKNNEKHLTNFVKF